MAVGKLPDSPRPSAKRARQNPAPCGTAQCDIAARLQNKTGTAYALLVPIQLMNGPNSVCPMA